MTGKVSPEDLKKYVFSRTGKKDKNVKMGPKYGEDTAAINMGTQTLVINSDPIIYAAKRIGTLGVNIASNDIAASGATPKWMTNVFFLPDEQEEKLDMITKQIDEEAKKLDISIVGGHSEYVGEIKRPFVSMTCMGTTKKYIPTSNAEPGDYIILTKGAAVEGTGILATDFTEKLLNKLDEETIKKAEKKFDQLNVLKESKILKKYANAMHDPTEGGIIDGLIEMAKASKVELQIKRNNIIIPEETEKICKTMNVDPLKIFGSGALLATLPPKKARKALKELTNKEIEATVIGEVKKQTKKPKILIDQQKYTEPIRDQTYDLWD